jgi:FKBP-type peptidyl-prolyl cis-trans isomerase
MNHVPPLRQAVQALLCVISASSVAVASAADSMPAAAARVQSAVGAPVNSSYEIGVLLGDQLEHNGLGSRLTPDELIRGLKDGLAGHAQTAQEREATLHFMRSARESLADSNRAAAREFLARNAQESNIRSTPSGLQYRVLAEGDPSGRSPAPMDAVTVRYRATLPDGHEFDRSDTHDRAATFRLNSVLKGWQEAILAMKPGAKWQLFVPPELGYGSNSPPGVPPGSLLIYELELLRVDPAPPMDPSAARHPPPAQTHPPPAHGTVPPGQ